MHFAHAVMGSDCGLTRETAMDPAAFSWMLKDMYPGYFKKLKVRRTCGFNWSRHLSGLLLASFLMERFDWKS